RVVRLPQEVHRLLVGEGTPLARRERPEAESDFLDFELLLPHWPIVQDHGTGPAKEGAVFDRNDWTSSPGHEEQGGERHELDRVADEHPHGDGRTVGAAARSFVAGKLVVCLVYV